ncbi:hypothetical protein QBK99_05655 [Corticibacterium sp. UT-5YL-CI-8]|nr:hypothetical protein [Tianweitania sp. UT-5YL-CI-8]
METVRATLEHTPWWVFVILVYIVIIGIKTLRTRVVAFYQLAIAPTIFAVWGIYTLFRYFGFEPLWMVIFAVAVLAGFAVGWFISRTGELRPVGTGQVEISGNPITLIVVLTLFVLKYALGYWIATVPGANQTFEFLLIDAGVTGVAIGIFIGRFAGLYQRYKLASPMPGSR